MDAVRKIIEHSTNPLTIELPEEYNNRKVEVIVLPLEEDNYIPKKNMTFHVLSENLNGREMLLAEQRKLQDEWD
jgi:hypothetical protein